MKSIKIPPRISPQVDAMKPSDYRTKILGVLFHNQKNANQAVQTLLERGYLSGTIGIMVNLDQDQEKNLLTSSLNAVGYREADQRHFQKEILNGKILVCINRVPEEIAEPIIDILNQHGNIRKNSLGKITGVAIATVPQAENNQTKKTGEMLVTSHTIQANTKSLKTFQSYTGKKSIKPQNSVRHPSVDTAVGRVENVGH